MVSIPNDVLERRLARIPEKYIWLSKNTCFPNAPLIDIVRQAEIFMAWDKGGRKTVINEDAFYIQPFLSRKAVEVISAALDEYDTVIGEDVPCLMKCRAMFRDLLKEIEENKRG